MTGNKQHFAIGDWIKGKSKNGELIRGFVEASDYIEGWVKIKVVTCDNEETVGRTVQTLTKWVEKLPESTRNEEQILQMVDLALLTRDESWFLELSFELNQLRQGRSDNRKKYKLSPILKNRWRRLEISEEF
ncbi:IDEAL domain-containing protein [Ammoniphilus resinae]|uniref:IDEAL domain-containing protein n=1 Tax=Ammoniphilus resinae TaxID=861532 RepID=A0ABS4GTS1_9BACL|nr:IDEAL domain-containing protein [Ammoniphilus resinae]MBP1933651.1 hypothetical protein [Ammoniphilus resinae]